MSGSASCATWDCLMPPVDPCKLCGLAFCDDCPHTEGCGVRPADTDSRPGSICMEQGGHLVVRTRYVYDEYGVWWTCRDCGLRRWERGL